MQNYTVQPIYCYIQNQICGPYTIEQLANMFRNGFVKPETQCQTGDNQWFALSNHPLFPQLLSMASSVNSSNMTDTKPKRIKLFKSKKNKADSTDEDEKDINKKESSNESTPPASTEEENEKKDASNIHSLDELLNGKTSPENSSISIDLSQNNDDDDPNDESPIVVCPHCWKSFHLSKIYYIARHPELTGDPVLGAEAQVRFTPTRFNANGDVLDSKGMVCPDMACPRCHLPIPEAIMSGENSFFSIIGSPSSGKSYFLTSMIFQIKQTMSNYFNYTVTDADSSLNMVLSNYESLLFHNSKHTDYVSLPKTALNGSDFASQVLLDGMTVNLPLPFVFTMRELVPTSDEQKIRNLVFYDNAGEHFEPGRGFGSELATQHLVKSSCYFFLFDPFKDSRTLNSCSEEDPQATSFQLDKNQLQILNETITRARRHAGLKQNQPIDKTLIVIVPKYDAWLDTFPMDLRETEFLIYSSQNEEYCLNYSHILIVSYLMRQWLINRIPEMVPTCEASFKTVYFLPASALGRIPEINPENHDMIGIRPEHLSPIWCEVPFLIYCWQTGIIRAVTVPLGDDIQDVSEYCHFINENTLRFTNPVTHKHILIPKPYFGATVYDENMQTLIQLPEFKEQ